MFVLTECVAGRSVVTVVVLTLLLGECLADNTRERAGEPTRNNSCQDVRAVPESLRAEGNSLFLTHDPFYQKYTEAYGIPILSSANVNDDALRRYCYEVRFLLAGNSAIRRSVYKKFGYFAVMGTNEKVYQLPGQSGIDVTRYNLRGLGAMYNDPVTIAGEENALCKRADLHIKEDVLVHEISHAVDNIGANNVYDDWFGSLLKVYRQAMAKNLWTNTYSTDTDDEYFAVGAQIYFNVRGQSAEADGYFGPIATREQLRTYDHDLFEMLWKAYPCDNPFIERCQSTRAEEDAQELMMDCDIGGHKYSHCLDLVEADWCDFDSDFMRRKCPNVCKDAMVSDQHSSCSYWASRGECDLNPAYMLEKCKVSCHRVRWTADQYSDCQAWARQGLCADMVYSGFMATNCPDSCASLYTQDWYSECPEWAQRGDCVGNPRKMMAACAKSCNAQLKSVYVDYHPLCESWAAQGKCTVIPGYMLPICERSCHDQMASKDLYPECAEWAQRGDCVSDPRKMKLTCAQSCKDQLMSVHADEDEESTCQAWAAAGECKKSPKYMTVNCERSCYNQVSSQQLRDWEPRCSDRVDLESLCADSAFFSQCEKTCTEVLTSSFSNKASECQERADRGECSQFDMIVDCPTFCYKSSKPNL